MTLPILAGTDPAFCSGICCLMRFLRGFVLPEEPEPLAMPSEQRRLPGGRTGLVSRSEPLSPEEPEACGPSWCRQAVSLVDGG